VDDIKMECQATRKVRETKEEEKGQKILLKEVRETNIKLYWHNVVLKTKLKQR
jgi:hypothetical protein